MLTAPANQRRLFAAAAALLGVAGLLGLAFHASTISRVDQLLRGPAPEIVDALNRAALESLLVAFGGILAVLALRPSQDQLAPSRATRGLGMLAGGCISVAGAVWFLELWRTRTLLVRMATAETPVFVPPDAEIAASWPAFLLATAAQVGLFLLATRLAWTQEPRPPAPGARFALPLLTFAIAVGMAASVLCARGHAAAANALYDRPVSELRPSDLMVHLDGLLRYALIAAVSQFVLGALVVISSTTLVLAPASSARRAPAPGASPTAAADSPSPQSE